MWLKTQEGQWVNLERAHKLCVVKGASAGTWNVVANQFHVLTTVWTFATEGPAQALLQAVASIMANRHGVPMIHADGLINHEAKGGN